MSKNYKVNMQRYQDDHFRVAIKVFEPNVVETFVLYFIHLPSSAKYLFYLIIDNLRTSIWYAKGNKVSEKNLSNIMKTLYQDNSLSFANITNKVDHASLISWLQKKGVSNVVGMRITGQKVKGAYLA